MIVLRTGILVLPPDRLYDFLWDGRNLAALKEQPKVKRLRLLRTKEPHYLLFRSMHPKLDWYAAKDAIIQCCDQLLALPEPERWYVQEDVA